MKIAVIVVLYLVGIPLSVIIMAFFNRKVLAKSQRAPAGTVIAFALLWPIGLPSFIMLTLLIKAENSSIKERIKLFIEGE